MTASRSTVGALLRSTQAFCAQLCEKETLDYGIAYFCPRFPSFAEVNQFREVLIEDSTRIPDAFEQAERWFQQHRLTCLRWAPAGGGASEDLHRYLVARGFVPRSLTVWVATQWVDLPAAADVRIVPARAARAAYRQTFLDDQESVSADDRTILAEAYGERLDDPSFDAVVALVNSRAAGRCALFQVGDIARIMDLIVLPEFAGRGVETALLAHGLALAKRLAMRTICAALDRADTEVASWFEAAGFEQNGTITEFERELGGNHA